MFVCVRVCTCLRCQMLTCHSFVSVSSTGSPCSCVWVVFVRVCVCFLCSGFVWSCVQTITITLTLIDIRTHKNTNSPPSIPRPLTTHAYTHKNALDLALLSIFEGDLIVVQGVFVCMCVCFSVFVRVFVCITFIIDKERGLVDEESAASHACRIREFARVCVVCACACVGMCVCVRVEPLPRPRLAALTSAWFVGHVCERVRGARCPRVK